MAEGALPAGWQREYDGRHGVEYFYEPRNLTVSVLPRYDSPGSRASQMEPSGYLVRVHRLFSSEFTTPLTVGLTDSFPAAKELATRYMEQFTSEFLRRGATDDSLAIEALSAVADYSDDLFVDVVQSRTKWGLRGVAHCSPDSVDVVYQRDGSGFTDELAARLYDSVRGVSVGSVGSDGDSSSTGALVTTDGGTAVWVTPDGDPDCGTLCYFAPDTALSVPALFEDTAELLRRRPN
ncbi:hypothetical protein [Haloarchaeobius sp. DFWS5]|uniref:hypothetical protein n=1 Tax=Haloarchaeobius sp. DFWS5 TaxID=3446114 RepID=UPI003EB783C1